MNADSHRWDLWCRRYGIDPNTSDERYIDHFLHGTEPPHAEARGVGRRQRPVYLWEVDAYLRMVGELNWRDEQQRDYYQRWHDFDEVLHDLIPRERERNEASEREKLEEWFRL